MKGFVVRRVCAALCWVSKDPEFRRWFWKPVIAGCVVAFLALEFGLPEALRRDRIIAEERNRAKRVEELQRARIALGCLAESIAENKDGLQRLAASLEANKIPFSAKVDSASWDAVKSEVLLLRQPELQSHLATYFSWVERIKTLHSRWYDLNLGPIAALAHDIAEPRAIGRENLTSLAQDLVVWSDNLLRDIERERARIGAEVEGRPPS